MGWAPGFTASTGFTGSAGFEGFARFRMFQKRSEKVCLKVQCAGPVDSSWGVLSGIAPLIFSRRFGMQRVLRRFRSRRERGPVS